MKVRRVTIFRLLSFFVALIVGLCACDQTGQLLLPGTPDTEAPADEDSRRCRPLGHGAVRRFIWRLDRTRLRLGS